MTRAAVCDHVKDAVTEKRNNDRPPGRYWPGADRRLPCQGQIRESEFCLREVRLCAKALVLGELCFVQLARCDSITDSVLSGAWSGCISAGGPGLGDRKGPGLSSCARVG